MNLDKKSFAKKAFDITTQNPILAQPFVIFAIVLSFTVAGLSIQTDKIRFLVFALANILLACAFVAGWFFMIKQGIYLHKRIENGEFSRKEERAEASFALSKAFFHGVGELFIHTTFTVIFYAILNILVFYAFYKLGLKILPYPDIDWKHLYSLSNASAAEIQKYVFSLSFEQIKAVNLWMMYALGVFSGFTYLTMFLFPAMIDADPKENLPFIIPFKAFLDNLKFLYKNFFGSLGIIIYLFVLNTIMSFLSIIFNFNIILSIVGLIISFYFITYATVLIFLYYEDRK